MFNNDHIDTLIAREIEGEITTAERAQLEDWLQQDVANRQYYEALKDTWDLTADGYKEVPEPDVEANWQRFTRTTLNAPAPLRVVTKRNNWWRLSAAAVVIVAAAGLAFTLLNNQGTVTLTAALEKKEVILPDCSKVFLNRHSQVSYRRDFAKTDRTVTLEGEAFFDVKPDAARPFMVRAGASQTRVLGTSFLIKAYEHKTIQLNVVTGKVAFSGKGSGEAGALVLTAGHSAILQSGKEPKQVQEADPNFMAWKENRLAFTKVPLHKTLSAVEEYFNIRIIVTDTSLLNLDFSGTFENPGLDEVLDVISKAADVKVTEEEPGVYHIGR
jgi:ferric-dicitrate binding protein FerR (iron transport regulator)